MANSNISDIANGIELGENRSEGVELGEAIKAGKAVKKSTAAKVIKSTTSDDGLFLGIMGEHYNVDLDTQITSGYDGTVVTEGYCPAFVDDPGESLYAGAKLYEPESTDGNLSWTAGSADKEEPVATLVRDISNGDTVAIIKLVR